MPNRATALLAHAARTPNKIAIHFMDQQISFAALADRVRATASGLAALGICKGSHVGLLLPSTPDFIVLQQALFLLGAVFAPLNILYKDGEICSAAACCGLAFLVTDAAHSASLSRRDLPLPCRIICADSGFFDLASASAPIEAPAPIADDATAMLLLTSATTGKAKAVMLSAANLAANYDRTPRWLGLDGGSVILCALPLYNTFGLNQGINVMTSQGATLVLLPRFDAESCLAAILRHDCSFFPAVPTMLQKILDHPGCTAASLAPLRRILTGAAPVPVPLLQRLADIAPQIDLLTGYGLTEGTALVTICPVRRAADGSPAHGRSIGRVLDGIELAIADEEGRHLPPPQTGEIILRGPNIMRGYLNAEAETATALRDGWLHTGDIGYLDEEGYAYILDRKKDLIIRGGQNIYPADIEEALYQVSNVAEAAVIGGEDSLLGEVPIAYVAASPGAPIDIAQLWQHCRTALAPFKVPVAIHILAELPKGPTGKILRRALRASTS
jgi:long-chain acyl-CoA synthetase